MIDSFATWSVGLLVADRALAGHTGLLLTERFGTENGGIPVQFLVAQPSPATVQPKLEE